MAIMNLLRKLDLSTLLFLAVQEEGTLTRAAEREAIAVSAASKRLVALELEDGWAQRELRIIVRDPQALLEHLRSQADHGTHFRLLRIAALGVMGAGVVAAIPAFWALPPKLVTGAGAAGGIALINTPGQLGGIVSPVMVGRIKDISGSATPALYVIAGLSLLCALIVMAGLPQALRSKE